MGQPNLTDEQFEVLAQYYKDPKIPSNVMWTRFLTDTEMGEWHFMLAALVDHYTSLENCLPTPPLSQHFALCEKYVLMLA